MNTRFLYVIWIVLCCLLPKAVWGNSISVGELRTEGMENPMGIDTSTPRLGWIITSSKTDVMQEAYAVLVASSLELLAQDKGDLWNSGKVQSGESQWVRYAGKILPSNQRCYWKVKVYTNKGVSDWSSPASWSVGLLGETHWRGQWIGMDKAYPWDSETQWSRLSARYLRKEFDIKKQVKRATLHIAGLGLYELYVNGKKIGDQVLAPGATDYRKTVIYNSFDVTENLKKAKNAVGVILGNGRYYTMRQNYKQYKIVNFGYPKMRLNLIVEYTDGSEETIVSDKTWKLTADGPIRSNNEYDGEEYDSRKELGCWNEPGYNDSFWEYAQRVSIPTGTLRGAMAPNMKVLRTVKPVSLEKVENKWILDMGQNMVGWLRIKIKGEKGDSIRLRFAETLQKNGELYTENLRDALVTDIYVCNGKEPEGTTWAPRFVYHGFRYVELMGYENPQLEDFMGEVVSDRMDTIGEFECSNQTLNRIYRNAWWGILGNYKSFPIDCPQRNERQPWLGDRAMGSWGESYMFDNAALYSKWTRDICEAQREDGCIPDVAPAFWNYYTDNVTWPSTLVFATDMLYTQRGNVEPMERCYPYMRKWMLHLRKEYMNEEGIITKDRYGDWCVPPESPELIHSQDPARQTDGALISTAYYVKMLQLMERFAAIQGLESDKEMWYEWEQKMKADFNRKFLHVKRGTSVRPGHVLYPDSVFYGNNTVTANLLPLAFDIVPEDCVDDVARNVVATITLVNNEQICCGVIGVQWLMRELSERGFSDVAFALAINKKYPSWGYMAEQGATTIWELWNGDTANPEMNSGNHVMLLGDLVTWCYENLGGIRSGQEILQTGYRHIVMKPNFEIQNLEWVNASYHTPYGTVESRWKKNLTHLVWNVTIPCNTTAEVYLPDGNIRKVGSGNHCFEVDMKTRHPAIVKDEFLYNDAPFPSCHAGTIVELDNGDLVAAFFGGTYERHPDCCIWVCRKPKGASEWTAPVLAADGVFDMNDSAAQIAGISENIEGHRKACWNPVLFQHPDGDLLLYYKIGLKVSDWTGWLVRSKDGGRTWSKREPLPEGFLGPVKNKPEIINGRIIFPSSTEYKDWCIHFEYSDDGGKTWKKSVPEGYDRELLSQDQNNPSDLKKLRAIQTIQPSILKHKDGSLQVLCRTRNARLATSWSKDNGTTWSKVTLTDLPNNNSGTDAVTLKDGRHVLVYNDFAVIAGERKGVRTPLSLAVSEDGIRWKHVLTLEDSPVSQYSYPAVIQGENGNLHVIYTWRRQRMKYMEIDLKKLGKYVDEEK